MYSGGDKETKCEGLGDQDNLTLDKSLSKTECLVLAFT